jgi:hypothetical protein
MRRAVTIAFSLALVFAAPGIAAARLPAVLTEHNPAFQVRPATIDYTGDGSAVVGGLNGSGPRQLGRLKWTTYNERQGSATGLLWINNCMPDCADGRFSSVRVSVKVFSPHSGHFRRLTLTYTYRGHHYVDRREIHLYRTPGARIWGYQLIGA